MFAVTTFYRFVALERARVERLAAEIGEFARLNEMRGLLLLGGEGCNGTVSGSPEALEKFKSFAAAIPEFSGLEFKDSVSSKKPFKRFKIDVREEIVAIKDASSLPPAAKNNHLSPQEWQAALESGGEMTLLDTRNFYETEIGKFRGALDLKIKKFSDFPEAVQRAAIPKERKVLMYCTGGIRCEKAIVAMQNSGYRNVFQLEGGILKYLEHFPDRNFEGECFVFDHRVAVGQNLMPSTQYAFCPHCGNAAKDTLTCLTCGKEAKVCPTCRQSPTRHSCSKTCRPKVPPSSPKFFELDRKN